MTQTAERPTWRDVNIDLLAEKLQRAESDFISAARSTSSEMPHEIWGNIRAIEKWNEAQRFAAWNAVAEAAVDELIDRPEREFQAQCDAVLAPTRIEPAHIGSWTPATASDWLPEHA